MSSTSYIEVAYFLKTFGLKGEIKAALLDNIELDFTDLDVIFLEDKGQKIPYFIDSVVRKKDEFILKLDDVDTPELAKELCKKKIYIDEEVSQTKLDITENPALLKGYKAFQNKQHLGNIDRLDSYPQQTMAIIIREEGEILIPLVEQFIEYIDPDEQEIHFLLPDGFLDL